MTPELLEKLKRSLPPKGIKTIAEKLNLSEDMVRKVLNNDKNNENVIDAAIELAKEYKEKQEERIQTINSL
jgi:hypothetical protein